MSDGINLMVGTAVAGGLSTFSSFAYGTVVLMSGSAASVVVASAYVLSSLFLGYVAVVCRQQVASDSTEISRIHQTHLRQFEKLSCWR